MSRELTPTILAASQAEVVSYILFAELDFESGFVRVNSSSYEISWNGFTWAGLGMLGEVSPVSEDADLTATKYTLSLSGVPSEVISITLSENYKNRDATIWLGLVDSSANLVILDAPVIVFQGWIDSMAVSVGDQSKVSVVVETKLADWSKPRVKRYTSAEQQLVYPDDMGFEYVADMEDYSIVWGRG